MKLQMIETHMKAAYLYAENSTCKRRQVGCVITKNDRIISIGYNGTPSGWNNCCEGVDGKTLPEVLHAESNAIGKLAKSSESGDGSILFTTTSPCIECAKLIAQSGISKVYYSELYKNSEGIDFLTKFGVRSHQVKAG